MATLDPPLSDSTVNRLFVLYNKAFVQDDSYVDVSHIGKDPIKLVIVVKTNNPSTYYIDGFLVTSNNLPALRIAMNALFGKEITINSLISQAQINFTLGGRWGD